MLANFWSPDYWIALAEIIGVNILLSGDNAVVIALACRSLPPAQQKRAILMGSAGAIVLRIVLTFAAVYLLGLQYLKIIGSLMLAWIGIKLLVPEHEGDADVEGSSNMIAAVRTVIIADFVMSLDNVLAVAAVAKDSKLLVAIGLLVSIPLIIYGSTLIMKLMDRFPAIVTLGGALLGYVAGEMALSDLAWHEWIEASAAYLHYALPIAGAVVVVIVGRTLAMRQAARRGPLVDLAADGPPDEASRK